MKRPRLTAFDRTCFESGNRAIIGVDEAGRGALAGPVVAAACWVGRDFYETAACRRVRPLVRDSKQLTFEQREEAFARLETCSAAGGIFFSPGVASVNEIADENILGATRLAMRRAIDAVLGMANCPDYVWRAGGPEDLFHREEEAAEIRERPLILVDGRPLKPFIYPHTALVKGDGRSFAIAAASIVAKVTRDRMMVAHHDEFPMYGFDSHKGYGTPRHVAAIEEHGIAPLHRAKFLRKLIAAGIAAEAEVEDLFEVEM